MQRTDCPKDANKRFATTMAKQKPSALRSASDSQVNIQSEIEVKSKRASPTPRPNRAISLQVGLRTRCVEAVSSDQSERSSDAEWAHAAIAGENSLHVRRLEEPLWLKRPATATPKVLLDSTTLKGHGGCPQEYSIRPAPCSTIADGLACERPCPPNGSRVAFRGGHPSASRRWVALEDGLGRTRSCHADR